MVQVRRREDGLDETDQLIVAELKQNAPFSNVELAKRVNLSPTPCYERVRKLERTGVLKGYHAKVDCSVLGQAQLAYVTIEYSSDDQAAYGDLLAALSAADDVLELSELAGVTKLRIKIAGTDITTISERLKQWFQGNRAVVRYSTEFVTHAHIDRF